MCYFRVEASRPGSVLSTEWRALGWVAVTVVLTLTAIVRPANAVVELLTPIEETPPTSEDLNGVAAAPNGDYIVVGNGPTVLHRATDAQGNPVWTSLGSWAAGFFSAEIFTVVHSPVAYPAGDAFVLGGRETLVETDFTDTLVVDQRPGSNAVFTPVLPTTDAIWYGEPDLGINPSFLYRYDRATQSGSGIAFTLGAVLALCDLGNGSVRYVTTDGDIEEIDASFQVTVIYDQDDFDPLELNAASFSEDCSTIIGGDATPDARVYAGFVDAVPPPRGPSFTPWRFRSRPGEPAVTASGILTPQEQAAIRGYFGVILRCGDNVDTGDDSTMSALSDLLNSRILKVSKHNEEVKCQRALAQAPAASPRRPGPLNLSPTADFEMLTVGTEGRVQRVQGTRALFFDTFESGDLSRWSSVSP